MIFCVASLLLFPTVGWGKMINVPSLEWMTQATPLIVRGRVASVKKSVASPDAPLFTIEDIVVKVQDVLKGDFKQSHLSFKRLQTIRTSATQWMMEKSDLILFLRPGTETRYTFGTIDFSGSLVLYNDLPFTPINLDHLSENIIILTDFTVSRDKDEILKVIKQHSNQDKDVSQIQQAQFEARPQGSKILEMPENSEAYRAFESYRAISGIKYGKKLIVPEDL